MRSRQGERGAGWVGTIFWLAVLGAMGYAGLNVVPTYIAHYTLADRVNEVARSPRNRSDDQLRTDIYRSAAEQKLDRYIDKRGIEIRTSEVGRRITLSYDVELQILPGWKRNFHFDIESDQPII